MTFENVDAIHGAMQRLGKRLLYDYADPKAEPRHMEDLLIRIRPTTEEVRAAVTWLLDRKTSARFRSNVRRAVEALGYDDISHSIPE